LTAERVSRGWVLYLRVEGGRKIYVKKLNMEQARTVVDGDIDAAQAVGRSVMAEKYGDRAVCLGFDDPDKHWRRLWTYSLGVWVEVGKIGCWKREGILIIKRKKGNQWAYYVVEKPKDLKFFELLKRMPYKKARMFRRHQYVAAVPKGHLQLIFKRSHLKRIPEGDLKAIFRDLTQEQIFVMKWQYVEPYRFKTKVSVRPSREDEGIIGELQSEAEDRGWGEVEEELTENGEWETIEELRDEGYLD